MMKTPKQVGLLHYAAPPIVGGVESVLGHQARLMADAGHQVRILAGRGSQVDGRVPFVRMPLADSRHPEILALKPELSAGHIPDRFDLITEKLYRALLERTEGLDYLIAHNVCSLNKNMPLTAALRQLSGQVGSPRLILWHHDLAWTTPRYRSELHEGYPWILLREDWPGVIQVVVSEPRQRELADLLQLPLERIRVIPNGLDSTGFLKLEDQTRTLIQKLDLLNGEPLLLLPVRITPRKNIELALRVLAGLLADYPAARLVVTGPLGPHNPANVEYFERLDSLRTELGVGKCAHFLAEMVDDYLPDAVIADFYRLADALFMPSREEGFGIPLLEAGLSGLPVFCADIPPLRDLGGAWASYFSPEGDPGNIAALVKARLSQDPTFHLRVRVRKKYTWGGIFHQHIAPLLDL
ncbi:MAG TPA: glycosyltransferase [Anaerolineales bacterium]|nr:glycosyltransferase [Anaerolineales bacterium]